MAFDQTLLSSISNTSFSFLKTPFSNTKSPTLLSVNFVCSYPKPNAKRLPFSRNLKCSVNYRDNQVVEYPKPAEIPWNKEICNSVHLIGNVGAPVEIKHLPSGKAVAWTRIGVRKSASETSWINLTFWDELAEVAARHLEKGNQIYVSGRLIADTVETEDGKLQTYYKVVVQQLNLQEVESLAMVLQLTRVTRKSYGKHFSLALWSGGIIEKTRGIRNIQISSTKILEKLCGLKGDTILRGSSPNWQYWMKEWDPVMIRIRMG